MFLDQLSSLSFLVTASEPTYVIVMNGSALDEDRNLTGQGKGLDGDPVTNGTPCDTNVSNLQMVEFCLGLVWVVAKANLPKVANKNKLGYLFSVIPI